MNSMKCALAVVLGYVLGRWHKARWALALAGMAAGKRISTNPRVLLEQLVESSPQIQNLVGDVRGELVEAGKKAAVAAAGNRLEGITEQLRDRTASLKDRADGDADDGDETDDEKQGGTQRKSRSQTSRKTSSGGSAKRSEGSRKPASGRSGSASSSSRPASRTAKKKTTASSSSGRKTTGTSARKSSGKSASTAEQE